MENYLAGTGRTVSHTDGDLRRSLGSNESSILSIEDVPDEIAAKRQKRAMECSRVCLVVLQKFEDLRKVLVGTVGLSCILQKWPLVRDRYTRNSKKSSLLSTQCI